MVESSNHNYSKPKMPAACHSSPSEEDSQDSFDTSSLSDVFESDFTSQSESSVLRKDERLMRGVSFEKMLSEKYDQFNRDNYPQLPKAGLEDSDDESKPAIHSDKQQRPDQARGVVYNQFNKVVCLQPKRQQVQSTMAQDSSKRHSGFNEALEIGIGALERNKSHFARQNTLVRKHAAQAAELLQIDCSSLSSNPSNISEIIAQISHNKKLDA